MATCESCCVCRSSKNKKKLLYGVSASVKLSILKFTLMRRDPAVTLTSKLTLHTKIKKLTTQAIDAYLFITKRLESHTLDS